MPRPTTSLYALLQKWRVPFTAARATIEFRWVPALSGRCGGPARVARLEGGDRLRIDIDADLPFAAIERAVCRTLAEIQLAELRRECWRTLLDAWLRRIRVRLDADSAALLLSPTGAHGNAGEIVAARGTAMRARGPRLPCTARLVDKFGAGARALPGWDEARDRSVRAPRPGMSALLGAPLIVDQETIGVVLLGRGFPRCFSPDDAAALDVLTRCAAAEFALTPLSGRRDAPPRATATDRDQ
jgi:hypothetical protein